MRPDSVEFAVILLASRELIGFGGLFDIGRALTASLFVGIGEERAYRGMGYGMEAVRLICEYGFFFRSLHGIKVEVNGYNLRAIKLYERLGFRPAGRIRGAMLLNGRRHDQIVMDLLCSELVLKHVVRFRSLEQDVTAEALGGRSHGGLGYGVDAARAWTGASGVHTTRKDSRRAAPTSWTDPRGCR